MSSYIVSAFLLLLLLFQPHPLLFALGLLLYSLVVSLSLMFTLNIWLGLSLGLIFMGGMMVIILYVSALASEYKFNVFSSSSIFLLTLWPVIPYSLSLSKAGDSSQVMTSLYFSFSSLSMFMLLLYLLLTLIIVVIISESFQGPVTSWN